MTTTSAEREARFLASRSARTMTTTINQSPHMKNNCANNDHLDNDGDTTSHHYDESCKNDDHPNGTFKNCPGLENDTHTEQSQQQQTSQQQQLWWSNFRMICHEFHCQIDTLLLVSTTPQTPLFHATANVGTPTDNISVSITTDQQLQQKQEKSILTAEIRSHYATAARRNEGRARLQSIMEQVRMLRDYCLSYSSLSVIGNRNEENSDCISNQENNEEENENENENESMYDDKENNNIEHHHRHMWNEIMRSKSLSYQTMRKLLPMPATELPPANRRLLSQEIDFILKRIDDAHDSISPKEKFVFYRYRRAMEEWNRSSTINTNDTLIDGDFESRRSLDSEMSLGDHGRKEICNDVHHLQNHQQQDFLKSNHGKVLENKCNCIIQILSDGSIQENNDLQDLQRCLTDPQPLHLPSLSATEAMATTFSSSISSAAPYEAESKDDLSSPCSAYLFQNLSYAIIYVYSPLLSLHIQHMHNCQLHIASPIVGPVHVTDCHNSKIFCRCHQLRVHDSHEVEFQVYIRSGPIIENCTGMVFGGNYYLKDEEDEHCHSDSNNGFDKGPTVDSCSRNGNKRREKNMYWDVKDFNWLRALQKSPNFIVVTNESNNSKDTCLTVERSSGKLSSSENELTGRDEVIQDQDIYVGNNVSLPSVEDDCEDEL